jgi:prolyl-tRNA editing enzyme YbaK/EbsC (Cys-tRNA(Pro) deacylase)
MMTMAEVIKRYLDGHGLDYKLHAANGPTMTTQDAATRLHVPLEKISKSILFTDEKETPILAILAGEKRAYSETLASVVGVSKVRIATPEATKGLACFEAGVMPPVAHKNRIATVIDQEVMSFSKVYGGSGTTEALMEIDPCDIARLTAAKVADISE